MVAVLASTTHLPSEDSSSAPPSTPSPATPPNTPSPSTNSPQQTVCKVSVTVPRDAVGFIIGKRGETVRNMMSRSHAFIHVDRDDTNPNAPHRVFHIQGDPAAVAAARALIREKVHAVLHGKPQPRGRDALVQTHPQSGAALPELDDDEDDATYDPPLEMWIPRGCVGMIIGHGGQVINEMQEKAGATIVVHNNKMDRHGAKLLTISGGLNEKRKAKHLIQNVLDRAGSRLRYMEHAHDTQHFFPQHAPHPHPHPQPPPWPYPQNTHVPFDPRQAIPDFMGMHPMSPWMHPLPLPPQNVPRQIVHQHPSPQTQHHLHHIPQQVLHQQPQSQSFNPQQPQLHLRIPIQHPPHLPEEDPQHTLQRSPTSEQSSEHQPDHSFDQQPHREAEPSASDASPGPQPQPQLSQPHTEKSYTEVPSPQHPSRIVLPLHSQPLSQPQSHPQSQPQPQPQSSQAVLQQHQQRLQALHAQQQTAQIQAGVFPSPQISSHVNPIFAQPIPQAPTPMPWNPAHVPYPVPHPLPVHGNNMMANHPLYKMNTKVVCVPSSCVGIVIGRSGETIRDLQQRSGAYIKVTPDRDASSGDPERLIYISGPPGALELAHSLVNDVINEGLSRNYRDGVEPRAPNEPQDTGQEPDQTEQIAKQPDVATSPGESPEQETTSLNGKSDEDVVSTSEIEKVSAISVPRDEESSVSEVQESADVSQEKSGTEQGPELNAPSSTDTAPNEADEDGEKTEDWVPDRTEDHAETDPDSHPNPFAGEGRLVQRPPTGYPSASISFEMKIPHAKVGVIIGKKGQTIRSLQQKSGARIVVSKKMDTTREDNPRAVTITGPKPFVDAARRLIVAIINPPADQKGKEGEAVLDPLEFDESLVGDEQAVEPLAAELSKQTITSPLPPIIPGSPSPISPLRVPQTPPFATFQRPVPFIGPNTPGQFGLVPPPYRPVMRGDHADFRGMEPPLQQGSQFQSMMGPSQIDERVQIPTSFPYEQTGYEQTGETEGLHEFRQPQLFPQGGADYGNLSKEGLQPFPSSGAGPAFSPVTPEHDQKNPSERSFHDSQGEQTGTPEAQP